MRIFLILLFLIPVRGATQTPSFKETFYGFLEKRDFSPAQSVLAEWKDSQPEDVEMLVAHGIFYYSRARRNDRGIPAPPPAVPLLHPPRTQPQDRAWVPVFFDRDLLLQAKPYWKKALEVSPDRLDLYFRMANLFGGLGDFESQYAVLAKALQRADRRSRKLLWIDGGELPEPALKMIPETLQGYAAHYLAQPEGKGMERARRIAKLSMTFYPRDPASYHSLAAYYAWKEDWPRTLKYLVLASQKDPQNGGVLNDIGNLLVKLEKPQEAEIYFEKTLRLDPDPGNRAWAEKRLEELRQGESEVSP
jgi:tetratricopeptide (TPR) repeat protein